MKVTVKSEIDFSAAIRKIESDEFWKFGAEEWERLISPYVPRREGLLMDNTKIRPKEIEYVELYSVYQYFGKTKSGKALKYRTNKNSQASKEWDKKAISEKKDLLLIQSMQKWIERNL